jgi:hypothetical protein
MCRKLAGTLIISVVFTIVASEAFAGISLCRQVTTIPCKGCQPETHEVCDPLGTPPVDTVSSAAKKANPTKPSSGTTSTQKNK